MAEPASIKLTWTWTEDDYVRAVLLGQSSTKQHRLLKILIPVTAVLLAIFWFIFGQDTFAVAFTSAFAVVVILYLGLRWWGTPRHARRVFRQQKDLHRPVTLELDDEGFRGSQGENRRGFLPWADCHRWVEGSQEFLVFPSDAMFHLIPKRHLDEAEIERVREILSSQVHA